MSETATLDAGKIKTETTKSVHQHYADRALGIMSCFAITWALMRLVGLVYVMTLDPGNLIATYNAAQIDYILDTPSWVRAAQGFSVVGTLIGSVYLLLRRKSAYYWFMGALAGTLVVLLDTGLRDGFHIMGGVETGVNVSVTVISFFLFWATYSAFQEGQLKTE